MAAGSAAERAEAKGRASARKRGREVKLAHTSIICYVQLANWCFASKLSAAVFCLPLIQYQLCMLCSSVHMHCPLLVRNGHCSS